MQSNLLSFPIRPRLPSELRLHPVRLSDPHLDQRLHQLRPSCSEIMGHGCRPAPCPATATQPVLIPHPVASPHPRTPGRGHCEIARGTPSSRTDKNTNGRRRRGNVRTPSDGPGLARLCRVLRRRRSQGGVSYQSIHLVSKIELGQDEQGDYAPGHRSSRGHDVQDERVETVGC